MARTVESVAMDLQVSKKLSLSGRQFEALCSVLRDSGDPEARARELALTQNREILEMLGDRKF